MLEDGSLGFPDELIASPLKMRGAPGVALLDHYDQDGDLDIFATNGPGAPNALLQSQLSQTGTATFEDVAAHARVEATELDGSGVCFGDIDHDDDPDLLVLSVRAPNRLYENLGNGRFADISSSSEVGAEARPSTSCAMGDVNGDGLVDIAIANAWDMSSLEPILVDPFGVTNHNQLLVNADDNVFEDMTEGAGFVTAEARITWAIAMVDYDQDGDVDIVYADDQGAWV